MELSDRGQLDTEQEKGLLKSGGCSPPLLKGRSTKGLNLDRTSARCERFQSFLCMNEFQKSIC